MAMGELHEYMQEQKSSHVQSCEECRIAHVPAEMRPVGQKHQRDIDGLAEDEC